MKTKINMRCTQEQFEAIKPKLVGIDITDTRFDLNEYPYLTNDFRGLGIGSRSKDMMGNDDSIIVETWDEQVFLEACGIEKIFKGSELQYRDEITKGKWFDCVHGEYRMKPNNTVEIQALENQIKELQEKLNKLKHV